jgi:hypothetical protein
MHEQQMKMANQFLKYHVEASAENQSETNWAGQKCTCYQGRSESASIRKWLFLSNKWLFLIG